MHFEEQLNHISTLSNEQMFNRLVVDGFIYEQMICPHCEVIMHLKPSNDNIDGLAWRCMNYKCRKYETSFSIRNGSWLGKYKISAKTIYKIILYWSNGLIQRNILRFVNIGRNTLSILRKFIISRISKYFENNPIQLGGVGTVVNVDETMINHKVKSHRGRSPRAQTWLLCITDSSFIPSRGFCCIVENRSASCLIPIISRIVRPGTTIYTDDFKSYSSLGTTNNYMHGVVTHKYHFVDPNTGVHTQHVESFNNKLKMKIKNMKVLNNEGKKMFLEEFMFLDLFKENSYIEIVKILSLEY